MKVHVNANCISCGLCVSLCPNVFHITEGGTAGVYSQEVAPELEARAQAAKIIVSKGAEILSYEACRARIEAGQRGEG